MGEDKHLWGKYFDARTGGRVDCLPPKLPPVREKCSCGFVAVGASEAATDEAGREHEEYMGKAKGV